MYVEIENMGRGSMAVKYHLVFSPKWTSQLCYIKDKCGILCPVNKDAIGDIMCRDAPQTDLQSSVRMSRLR